MVLILQLLLQVLGPIIIEQYNTIGINHIFNRHKKQRL